MKNYKWFAFLAVFGLMGFSYYAKPDNSLWKPENSAPKIDKDQLLDRHNYYRKKVGVPPLKWSDELTEEAQKWANKLAGRCEMVHSDSPYGENLYWNSGAATENNVVDAWASEERYFNHKRRIYRKGMTGKIGHYSQIIWRKTTEVGGAMQKCRHGGEIWVCNYNPHGNVIGSPVY